MKLKISQSYKIIFYFVISVVIFYFIGYKTNTVAFFNYISMFFLMLIPITHIIILKPKIYKLDIILILFTIYFLLFGTVIGLLNHNEISYIMRDNIKILFCLVMLIYYYAWYLQLNYLELVFILFLLVFSSIMSYINADNINLNNNIMLLIFLIYLFDKYKIIGKFLTTLLVFFSKKDVYLLDILILFFLKLKRNKILFAFILFCIFITLIYFFSEIVFYIKLFFSVDEVKNLTSLLADSIGSVGDRLFEIFYAINGMNDDLFTKVFGMGNGYSYDMEVTRRLGEIDEHRNVHMSIVNLYTKYGVVGLVFFIYLGCLVYTIVFTKTYTFYKKALVAIFYVSSFFSFTIFNMFIAWSFLSHRSK